MVEVLELLNSVFTCVFVLEAVLKVRSMSGRGSALPQLQPAPLTMAAVPACAPPRRGGCAWTGCPCHYNATLAGGPARQPAGCMCARDCCWVVGWAWGMVAGPQIIARGWYGYWKVLWNRFDFVLVTMSLVELIISRAVANIAIVNVCVGGEGGTV
jgi:hypothetical protein